MRPPGGGSRVSWLAAVRKVVVFRRSALVSWLVWPIAYPAAWIWRRTWLRRTTVIAVTGSAGKTSTAAAAAAVVGAAFDANEPNYGSHLAYAVIRHRPRRRCLVVEVGISRPGQMRRYARLLRPDVAVLTAINGDHLSSFRTLEALADEKALLLHGVRRGGLVVVNGDDELCRAIGEKVAARAMKVGFAADCEWRLEGAVVDWPQGTRLPLSGPAVSLDLATRWIGRDLARCAAFAAAIGSEGGVDGENVAARLKELRPTPWRLEPIALAGGAWLLCDAWKSTWGTIQSALRELADLQGHRRIAVLGEIEEPGKSRQTLYREYGRLAANAADRIVFVGGATNFYRFQVGVRKAAPARPVVERQTEAWLAAETLRDDLSPGTIVLVKGRHSQKLGRVAILLRGQAADCRLRLCPARGLRCELCPRLTEAKDVGLSERMDR
jgi:UDP-N-acetylmuramoyl-tripeptide--D-alanyl-D-alanine ligase